MRTRFLSTDFTGVVGCGSPFADLDFVAFPLPQLSHADYPSLSENLVRCFDDIPIFEDFGDVENLPIDNALCKFLFDVLPRLVDGDDLIDREEKSEVTRDEKKNGATFTSLDRNELEFLSYEIPEMDASLPSLQETAGYSQINPLHLSFEIPDTECTLDALDSERLLHDYVDAAMISCNGGKLLFDFVLSEEFSKTENCEEIVKACTDPSKSISSDKADLNSLRGVGLRERKNQDIRQKSDVEKASVFGESMSSDLHYFLDPCNYAKGRESVTWGRSVDVKAVHQLLMFNNDLDAAHTTVVKESAHAKMHQEKEFPSALEQKGSNLQMEESLDTINVKKIDCSESDEVVIGNEVFTLIPVRSMPTFLETEQDLFSNLLHPNTIIVVNTKNFSEEMIISRRTTYQRILELEKEGTQVIERDINLPVDLVINPAVCLSWYNSKNIRMKTSARDEEFSSLPLCVESIATDILTSLSYAFGCCILIFEGEARFVHSIMELSDDLYAAAACLGIDIQLFCSYSIEFTEEIILSCINVETRSSRGLYPKMSECESLGESFLSAFPSVNPLSAHLILSSGAILGKFLEMPDEGRICALQRYLVPDESISFLSATIRFGEREDNKSGITDCSSTLSVPESTNVPCKGESERKRPKHWHSTYDAGEDLKDLFLMESEDDLLKLPKWPVARHSWLSETTEVSDESAQCNLSGQRSLNHSHDADADADLVNYFSKSRHNDFPSTGLVSKPNGRVDRRFNKVSGFQQKNLVGEVIDAEDTPREFLEAFSLATSSCFSPFLLDNDDKGYADRNSVKYERPFCSTDSPMSSDLTDIDSASGAWVSSKSSRQMFDQITRRHSDTVKRSNISLTDHKEENIGKYLTKEAPQNYSKRPLQEKGFGGAALHTQQFQQGSPFTAEFFHRIREKARLRKQSGSYDLPSPCFGSSSTKKSPATKRKSPSVLDSHKQQGSTTKQKVTEQRRPKRRSSKSLHSAKNTKTSTSASGPSTSTPSDKRTSRKLSFSKNGCGGQTTLVWID